MKKLEDIPKQDIFKVPDGYFETLPSIIQARVVRKESVWLPAFRASLKYALPILVIAVGVAWFLNHGTQPNNPDQLIASISSQDLVEYMHEADITTEDLLESLDYSKINADSLDLNESHIIPSDDDLADIVTEFETEL